MKRRLLSVSLLVAMLLSIAVPCFAHDKEGHNRFLEEVLFGRDGYISVLSENGQKALTALEYASYLAVDQFNGKGTDELDYLKRTYRVPGLPSSLSTFDFSGNQFHRSYTHRGWDHEYIQDKANWGARRNLLLATTEKVFDFSVFSGKILGHDFGYAEKCNSVAALIYYVHIIGDHEARVSYKVTDVMMPLAQAHVDVNNPDILSEVKHHLQIIFADQQNTHKYKTLMQELDALAGEARSLAATPGGINTDEKFLICKDQVQELLTLLQDYVPNMLKDEPFFTDVFY